jgi:hypothetical protein
MSLSVLLYFFTYTPNLPWPNPHNTHAFLASLKHNSFTPCNKHTHMFTHIHIYKSATSHTYTHTFLKFYTY